MTATLKKLLLFPSLVLVCAAAAPLRAQNWEVGGLGLITTYQSVDVSNATRTGEVGADEGPAGGFVIGQSMGNRWGGEIRYLFFQNDFTLDAGGTEASFDAGSHAIPYDVLFYLSDPDTKIRPYVAFGAGYKYFEGTGDPQAFQPNMDLALLTETSEWEFMGDFGAGVKFRLGNRVWLRVEFRDYVSGIPKKVIAPAPGADVDGVFHHFVPLFGLTWIF